MTWKLSKKWKENWHENKSGSLFGFGHHVYLPSFSETHVWADEPSQRSRVYLLLEPVLDLELALLVSTQDSQSSHRDSACRSAGGNWTQARTSRAMCVQGNTSENHREMVVSTANLSDVPCQCVPVTHCFPCNTKNYQLGKLNGICDIAAAMSRQNFWQQSPPSPSSRPTSILASGLDPTPNSYISCSPSVLTNLFFTALELN